MINTKILDLSKTFFVFFVAILTISASTIKPIDPGTVAPSFMLPTIDGKREALKIWCGDKLSKPYINQIPHTVILSFWATYCKPCQKEIPELMAYYEKHKKENIKIFLISIDKEGASKVVPFVKEKGYTLPVLLDPYKRTADRYNVKSLPALLVISPDGIVKYSSSGFKDGTNLTKKLENIVSAIKNGSEIKQDTEQGESIAVKNESVDNKPVKITSKQKWNAVAKVECGQPIQKVAKELGVSINDIKSWYEDLKKAALTIWK